MKTACKNIIFDIGGIMFDDGKVNLEKQLDINCDEIYKLAFSKDFEKCLKGERTVEEHIESFKDNENYEYIKFILKKENLPIAYPLMKENYEYIKTLKDKGFKLYLLTNVANDSYDYIKNTIDIDGVFEGGVYTFQEGIIKPDHRIFEIALGRFNLDKNETVFFDDKLKNVEAAEKVGIKSFVFKTIDDIKNNICLK